MTAAQAGAAAAAAELVALRARLGRLRPLGPQLESAGEYVAAARLARSAPVALDGDTLGGIVVDGRAWPPVRLLGLDAPELHAHARRRYGADRWAVVDELSWSRSPEGRRARGARALLGRLVARGLVALELNPWRGSNGRLGERRDRYGRALARVYVDLGDVGAYLVGCGLAAALRPHRGRAWPGYWGRLYLDIETARAWGQARAVRGRSSAGR